MSIRDIIREVAEERGVRPDDILGRCRKRVNVHARQEVMWRARQVRWANGSHRYPYLMLERLLHRDHSTIVYGVAAHETRTLHTELIHGNIAAAALDRQTTTPNRATVIA